MAASRLAVACAAFASATVAWWAACTAAVCALFIRLRHRADVAFACDILWVHAAGTLSSSVVEAGVGAFVGTAAFCFSELFLLLTGDGSELLLTGDGPDLVLTGAVVVGVFLGAVIGVTSGSLFASAASCILVSASGSASKVAVSASAFGSGLVEVAAIKCFFRYLFFLILPFVVVDRL